MSFPRGLRMMPAVYKSPESEESAPGTIINGPPPSPPILHARKRIIAYRRRSQNARAKREIMILIQNKHLDDFLHIKRALFEIGSYKGKYLPSLTHKKNAGLYIRQHGLVKGFVEEFDDLVEWKFLR